MNMNLIDRIDTFIKESTPDTILASCIAFGCEVEDIEDTVNSNSIDENI